MSIWPQTSSLALFLQLGAIGPRYAHILLQYSLYAYTGQHLQQCLMHADFVCYICGQSACWQRSCDVQHHTWPNMSSNRFSTVSFKSFADSLQLLYLANNSLHGTLMSTLPANLTLLDVSYNDFSGPLPSDSTRKMSVLNVSHNAFNQSLPQG